jgi:hypothetical protein
VPYGYELGHPVGSAGPSCRLATSNYISHEQLCNLKARESGASIDDQQLTMARGKRKSRDGGGGRSGGARKRATAESPGEAGPADTSDDPSPDEYGKPWHSLTHAPFPRVATSPHSPHHRHSFPPCLHRLLPPPNCRFINRMKYTLRRRLTGMDSPLTTVRAIHTQAHSRYTHMLTLSLAVG